MPHPSLPPAPNHKLHLSQAPPVPIPATRGEGRGFLPISQVRGPEWPQAAPPLAPVNLEKDYIYQELLLVNWTQVCNQSLSAIADRGLHFREKPYPELSASCLLSQPLSGSSQFPLSTKTCHSIRTAQLCPYLRLYQLHRTVP